MTIELKKDITRELIASIQRYFAENGDEEIGELRAGLLLEFVLKEIGPTIYNHAITDAQAFMQERVTDLDGSCHEPELTYWKK